MSGPGTLVVTASVELYLVHSFSGHSIYEVSLANASAKCDTSVNSYVYGTVDYPAPTDSYYPDLTLVQVFPVGAAGTYAIDVIGNATVSGASEADYFIYASMAGVFYPS
ncbi:MAG: hypothetical protein ACLQD9_04920 [Thermoplasmata archaeon]